MTEIACGTKEFAPFPVSPKGKPGRVGSPHKRAAAPLGVPCECAGAEVGPVRNNRMFTEAKRPKIVADAGGWITPKLETALVAKKEKPPRRLNLTVPSHGSMHGKFGILGNVESVTYREGSLRFESHPHRQLFGLVRPRPEYHGASCHESYPASFAYLEEVSFPTIEQ